MICFRACYSISIQLLRPRKISRPSSRGTHLALDNFPELKSKNSGSVSFLPWGTSSYGQCGFDTILTCEMFVAVSCRRSRHMVSSRIRFLCMPGWLRSVEALDRLSKHPSRELSGTQQPSTSSALYGLKAVAALSSSRSQRKCHASANAYWSAIPSAFCQTVTQLFVSLAAVLVERLKVVARPTGVSAAFA